MQSLENVYLVGGAVRDMLLARIGRGEDVSHADVINIGDAKVSAYDMDYVVVGSSPEQMKGLGFVPVGKDFPVFLHPKTKDEYALARTERKTGRGYTGFKVDASDSVSLEEDLARRDLSVNAMAIDQNGKLIDPFNGLEDLKNKVLRHTTDAFIEDPVRVLRAARFLARFGPEWTIHPELKNLMGEMHADGELMHLVPERVWKETEKALNEDYPPLYFETLKGLDIFPEIDIMESIPQSAKHHPEGNVFTHTMLVLQRAADLNFDLPTRFAALTHDFGKPPAYKRRGRLKGHESDGVDVIMRFCERLRVPNKLKALAILTSDYHLNCHKLLDMTAQELHEMMVVKFDAVKQPERFMQFLRACQCDSQGRGPEHVDKPYYQYEYAQSLLDGLKQLDTKAVVKQAALAGKQGIELGQAVHEAQVQVIEDRMQIAVANLQ